jgi:transcriptional regulator with PAS, ATPase and Fis domain
MSPDTIGQMAEPDSSSSPRLLLIAKGRSRIDALRAQLAETGCSVDAGSSVEEVRNKLATGLYAAAVLDPHGFEPRQRADLRMETSAARGSRPVGLVMIEARPQADEPGCAGITGQQALDPGALAAAVRRAIDSARAREIPLEQFFIGRSAAIQRVLEQVRLVAPKDTTVLVTGETGTGKEKVSRAIHILSRRGRVPMVSVNCAGIPATLLEDEFFGHVKGAFTGAHQARVGRFEQADNGTIFLDEIGELPLELQPKLLRALQEREIHRVGGIEPIRLNFRVIAATNVDLSKRVEENRFREDLFYRVNVFHINVPPLRERPEDIPLFIAYFLNKFSRRDGLPPKYLAPSAERALMGRAWRGNIRELENAVEIAVIRSDQRVQITERDFPEVRESAAPVPQQRESRDFRTLVLCYERDLIERALDATKGNKNRAAQLLRIKRTTLIEKLKRFEELRT